MNTRIAVKSCALLLGAVLTVGAMAQNAPGGAPPAGGGGGGGGGMRSPAQQAIEYRKALFTLISGTFNPIGGILQGRAEYNAAEVAKRAERVAFLSTMIPDAFPEISKDGNTKAKPEIWSDADGFAKAVKSMQDSTAALAAVVKKDNTNSAAFKDAAGKVAESCKGCHDNYRAK